MTKAEAERLVLLAEECAEVVKTATKLLRFGKTAMHPSYENTKINNMVELYKEIGDLLAVLDLMTESGDIDKKLVAGFVASKRERLDNFTFHQETSKVKEAKPND